MMLRQTLRRPQTWARVGAFRCHGPHPKILRNDGEPQTASQLEEFRCSMDGPDCTRFRGCHIVPGSESHFQPRAMINE
jgi:hypothetical protein